MKQKNYRIRFRIVLGINIILLAAVLFLWTDGGYTTKISNYFQGGANR